MSDMNCLTISELENLEADLQQQLSSLQARVIGKEQLIQSEQALKVELAQIDTEIEVLRDVFQSDKALLNEQIQLQLKEKDTLSRKLFALEEEKAEKDKILVDLQTQIEKKNARSDAQISTDAEFAKTFDLPPSEKMINWFQCTRNMLRGYIYISTNYLCFAFNLVATFGHIVIPLKDIWSVRKSRMLLMMKSLEVKVRDGETFTFENLWCRADVITELKKRFAVLKVKVEIVE